MIEAAPSAETQHEAIPDLFEVFGEKECTMYGVTAPISQLAKLCPKDLSQMSVAEKNSFIITAANESEMEIEPEYAGLFQSELEKSGSEPRFRIAPASLVTAPDKVEIKLRHSVQRVSVGKSPESTASSDIDTRQILGRIAADNIGGKNVADSNGKTRIKDQVPRLRSEMSNDIWHPSQIRPQTAPGIDIGRQDKPDPVQNRVTTSENHLSSPMPEVLLAHSMHMNENELTAVADTGQESDNYETVNEGISLDTESPFVSYEQGHANEAATDDTEQLGADSGLYAGESLSIVTLLESLPTLDDSFDRERSKTTQDVDEMNIAHVTFHNRIEVLITDLPDPAEHSVGMSLLAAIESQVEALLPESETAEKIVIGTELYVLAESLLEVLGLDQPTDEQVQRFVQLVQRDLRQTKPLVAAYTDRGMREAWQQINHLYQSVGGRLHRIHMCLARTVLLQQPATG